MKYYILALRPRQWTKNFILFAGIIFSQNFFIAELILKTVFAFIAFCLLASSVYLFNDLRDIESDRLHPIKQHRPIACGKVKPASAIVLAVLLAAVSLTAAAFLDEEFFYLCIGYFVGMLFYSYFLKHVVILDIMIIAAGFVVRAIAGAAVIDVTISSWLLVCTTFIALFLVIAKRRHEVILLGEEAKEHRQSLEEYGDRFLDQMIAIVTTATMMGYILYTVDAVTIAKFGTSNLIYTAPFVLFGIFRYLYLVYQKNKGDRPEQVLLDDPPLLIAIFLWIITAILIIY